MPSSQARIRIVADAPAVAREGFDEVLRAAAAAIAARGAFRIALSGGNTPRALYTLLQSEGPTRGADFARWQVWFGDERCVPPDHPDSNFRMASEAWLGKSTIPSEQIHRVVCERGTPEAVADAYENEIRASFRLKAGQRPAFDVVLLGLGPDGHTASLFPDSRALDERARNVAWNWVEKFKSHRITLTLPAIDAARAVLFLVAGADKAPAVRAVLEDGPFDYVPPAKLVEPANGTLTWLLDSAAAAGLKQHT